MTIPFIPTGRVFNPTQPENTIDFPPTRIIRFAPTVTQRIIGPAPMVNKREKFPSMRGIITIGPNRRGI